ncbi:MBL fold metallo-hydrolase [Salinimonas marina]|uniref:MBL fold metallo-hydrolase n=1 Tax=Salinimonas marina TaxID=2785918 RepID=UPI001E5B5A3E|nr:MBL fold metallo-hydrolase [Salinimonas marina]
MWSTTGSTVPPQKPSTHLRNLRLTSVPGRAFANTTPITGNTFKKFIDIFHRSITGERTAIRPADAIPVQSLSTAQLQALPDTGIFFAKLGHSTVLFKIDGRYLLTDPMFARRASPFSFMGPERFHPMPITIEELPSILAVLLSHNHYDHLDEDSIRALKDKTRHFVVPLGLKSQLLKWGVEPGSITELDWWQHQQLDDITLTLTPSYHFSGRAFTDRNATLWGGWAINSTAGSLFFSGDSGYFAGFRTIGEKLGPFEVAFMENGAYASNWPQVHMQPEQTLTAFREVNGQYLVPIHNSTFDLAFHSWYAPLQQLEQHSRQQGVKLLTPRFGEVIKVSQPGVTPRWWQTMD